MSKIEQVNKNESLMNIKSLADFELNRVNPFITDCDKFRKDVNDLSDAIREKRAILNAKLEAQAAKEYEKALKEMDKADKSNSVDTVEPEDLSASTLMDTLIVEEDIAIDDTVIEKPIIVMPDEPIKEIVAEEPVNEEPIQVIAKPIDTDNTSNTANSIIPELQVKSRPKPVKEEAADAKGRIFIPDNSTKPSGQPINRYTDNLPKSRKPQAGEIRSTMQPQPSPRLNRTGPYNNNNNNYANTGARPYSPRPYNNNNNTNTAPYKPGNFLKSVAPVAPVLPKDTRVVTKRKPDGKNDESKKAMDKRTLIRRGFVDNVAPGAAFDYDSADNRHMKARRGRRSEFTPQLLMIEKAIITSEIVPIKVLSEKIGKSGAQIIKQLFILGIVKTINESIDFQTAELVANELGIELELNAAKSSEDLLADQFTTTTISKSDKPRPPVVTIMGHVDHGKTSLLDYIRKANVVSGEAGGITQHIGAYTVELNNQMITFLDTPGHQAFTSMRLRGAQVTDIVVIVVAADDGIMPQSIEAIAHAKASDVSIIVAINKMDKRTANPDRIKQQLTEHNLVPEEWGGDIICVPISAATGEGIDKLLESILLVAEMKELTADYDRYAKGVIIEAQLDKGKGPVATVLVQSGTLKVSDYIVAGTVIGKIRAMVDDKGNMIKFATPSQPVQIQGFDAVPQAGDTLFVVSDEKLARKVIDDRKDTAKSGMTINKTGTSLEDVFSKIAEGDIQDLNMIIKGDVQGSVEAIKQELLKLTNSEVKVNIVQASVGAITESDVMLAESSKSIIIGFNVRPDSKAKKMAERSNIDIKAYRIIYDIINDIALALKGMLQPKFKEKVLGRAEVRMVFKVTGSGTIAGCYVIEDKIQRNAKARLLRNNVIVYEGNISSLKRMKDDAKEVAQGYECGIAIDGYNDIKELDIIEAYVVEEIKD